MKKWIMMMIAMAMIAVAGCQTAITATEASRAAATLQDSKATAAEKSAAGKTLQAYKKQTQAEAK